MKRFELLAIVGSGLAAAPAIQGPLVGVRSTGRSDETEHVAKELIADGASTRALHGDLVVCGTPR